MEDLYVGYMKKAMPADEGAGRDRGAAAEAGARVPDYKLSKRYDSDISAVVRGLRARARRRSDCRMRVVFGGMAADAEAGAATVAVLRGRRWTEDTARAAMAALATDYTPLTDMRASADYRMRTRRTSCTASSSRRVRAAQYRPTG